MAEAGETGPLWIVAAEQTGGRGRLGRAWISKPGNLYATYLFPLGAPLAKAGHISFIAALAVHDVATSFAANANITLKWPNDCLLDGSKFSGVLSEIITPKSPLIALGVGLNIAHAPPGLAYPTTCLGSHSKTINVKAAYEVLAARLGYWLSVWNEGKNFTAIRSAWEFYAANIGQVLSVDTGQMIRQGTFKGLSDEGAMILSQADGTEIAIHAGDVRPAATQEQSA